jgi:hypothetical protein
MRSADLASTGAAAAPALSFGSGLVVMGGGQPICSTR